MSIINVEDETERLLGEKPEYREILKRIIMYEESHPKPESAFIKDEPYDTHWEYDDVRVQPARLGYLVSRGILTKVFDSNNTTAYALEDREAVARAIGYPSIDDLREEIREGMRDRMNEYE